MATRPLTRRRRALTSQTAATPRPQELSEPRPHIEAGAAYAVAVRTRILVVLTALLATVGADAGARGQQSSARAPALAVLGFQSEGSPARLIDRSARSITLVGVDGVDLTGSGEVSRPDRAADRQLARAHADGLPAVLLVGNWSDRVNDFYEPLAHRTLGSPSATARAASSLAQDVVHGGWNGVSVDLESLAPRDRSGLTRFVADLRSGLPSRDWLTVCVSAFTSLSAYRANGYDLAGLAARADQIVLMTYDDHGPWENTPGPYPAPALAAGFRAGAGARRGSQSGAPRRGRLWLRLAPSLQ